MCGKEKVSKEEKANGRRGHRSPGKSSPILEISKCQDSGGKLEVAHLQRCRAKRKEAGKAESK
jgi:hypothetical protein